MKYICFSTLRNISGVPDYNVKIFREKRYETVLIVPVLNEIPRILHQLRKILSAGFEVDVVIADGGSEDGLEKFIQDGNISVTAFLTKLGAGKLSAQLRMSFHFCLLQKYKYVITMDGNDKDEPNGIKLILAELKSGVDFVQGSRFINGGKHMNTPLSRYFAIRFVHAPITSMASRFRYTDTTNGFRGYSRNLLENDKLHIFRDIFDTYEMLAYLPIAASRAGMKISEVPVTRRYPKGQIPTKIKGWQNHLMILVILLKAVIGAYNPKERRT